MVGSPSRSLKTKSFAVASGKGGVGKSITALNFALQFAKRGLRVGVVDLDPLSNIHVLLDVDEETLGRYTATSVEETESLDDVTLRAFERLHLLFPAPKTGAGDSVALRRQLHERFADELDARFDIVIFDMPAGISKDENLAFLPQIGNLIVVVQTEPTSQVSAGGYLKAALEIAPSIRVFLLYNRVSDATPGMLRAESLAQTYNRYVPEELQLTETQLASMRRLGVIPEDPALDLLQDSFSPDVNVLYRVLGLLSVCRELILPRLPKRLGVGERSERLLRSYMARYPEIEDPSDYVEDLADYLAGFLASEGVEPRSDGGERAERGAGLLTKEQFQILVSYVGDVKASPEWRSARAVTREVETRLDEIRNAQRAFFVQTDAGTAERVEQLLGRFLRQIHTLTKERGAENLHRRGGVLLFYLSMLKLQRSERVQELFRAFVPYRKEEGREVRDRYTQIRRLVEKDQSYHDQFLSTIRRLYPVLTRQLSRLVSRFELYGLLLQNERGEPHREAYFRLLTQFLHDTVNSGLGVAIGIRFTPASDALRDGANELLELLSEPAKSA